MSHAAPSLNPTSGARALVAGRRRYEVIRQLGKGGMAEVYLCNMIASEAISRRVAVKVIRADFATRPEFRAALAQEARFACLLTHPNIVSVLDFDQDDDKQLFLVMEYLDGMHLGHLVAGRALPQALAIFVATEVLQALEYAHTLPHGDGTVRGIVHRDVSPQNVLVDRFGTVKLTDFGIAKAITTSGLLSGVKGKVAYMSPEQAAREPIDARSDLFSLGAVLWEMLTGRRLFEGNHARDVISRIMLAPIPPPSTVTPIAPDLEAVVMKLLAKRRDDRYASAPDAAAALLTCRDAPTNGPTALAAYLAKRSPSDQLAAASASLDTGATQSIPDLAEPITATGEPLLTGDATITADLQEQAAASLPATTIADSSALPPSPSGVVGRLLRLWRR